MRSLGVAVVLLILLAGCLAYEGDETVLAIVETKSDAPIERPYLMRFSTTAASGDIELHVSGNGTGGIDVFLRSDTHEPLAGLTLTPEGGFQSTRLTCLPPGDYELAAFFTGYTGHASAIAYATSDYERCTAPQPTVFETFERRGWMAFAILFLVAGVFILIRKVHVWSLDVLRHFHANRDDKIIRSVVLAVQRLETASDEERSSALDEVLRLSRTQYSERRISLDALKEIEARVVGARDHADLAGGDTTSPGQ